MDGCLCQGFPAPHHLLPATVPPSHKFSFPRPELHTPNVAGAGSAGRYPGTSLRWEMLEISEMFASLDSTDVPPSLDFFIHTIQKCRKSGSLPDAIHAILHIHNWGLEGNSILGNHLVPLLSEFGSFTLARKVFSKLASPNEHAWTSLMQTNIECGEYANALDLYEKMQENDILPSRHTFVAAIKACSRLKDIDKGRAIFVEIVKEELENDLYVGNILVDMYAKCGLITEANEVFLDISIPNVVSCTALVSGYAEHGLFMEAISCFEQMEKADVYPNAITCICVLKACTSMGLADKGQEIHRLIVEEGFEIDVMVGNALIDMYTKCGRMEEAHDVFEQLPDRDVITWTTLMGGYVEHGMGEVGLILFELMQLEGLSPNSVTYVSAVQACCTIGDIEKLLDVHVKIISEEFEVDPILGSSLVDVYASFGMLEEAEDLFGELPVKDLVAWTSMMAGYIENGLADEVLSCLNQMQKDCVPLDAFTISCSLTACATTGDIERGQELHVLAVVENFETESLVSNGLVDMYSKCGLLLESKEVFNELHVKDAVSLITLATGYAELGYMEEASERMKMIRAEEVCKNSQTVVSGLNLCADTRAYHKGQEIHAETVRESLEGNKLVGSSLVNFYAKCGKLVEAQEVFDELVVKDIISWTGLITGYADYGHPEAALELLKLMQHHEVMADVIAWSSVITGFNKQGNSDKALTLYDQMLEQGVLPNMVTLVSVMKGCGETAALDRGKRVHSIMRGIGYEDISAAAALVDMYGECGSIIDAENVFDTLPTEEALKWNTLISGLARHGECKDVSEIFDGMRRAGVLPDGITLLNVLSAYSHAGLPERALNNFEAMTRDYCIKPDRRHYNSMIDLLCRAGRLNEAISMIESMPWQPDLALWNTLLCTCSKWKNVEIGIRAFEKLMKSGGGNAAVCVLMSNLYAEAGMMDDAMSLNALLSIDC